MKMYCIAAAIALGATFVLTETCLLSAGSDRGMTVNIVQLH